MAGIHDGSVQKSKKIGKSSNDPVNEITHALERFKNGLTLANLRLVERYIESELHILIEFRYGPSEKFLAYLQRERAIGREVHGMKNVAGHVLGIGMSGQKHCCDFLPNFLRRGVPKVGTCTCNQHSMLVPIVKFPKFPEQIVSTLVWFDRIDALYSLLPHSLYFSSKLGRHVFRGRIRDGEGCNSGWGLPVRQDELVSEVVESTPQVLENIASDRENPRRNIADLGHIKRALSRLNIILEPNFIGVGFEESIEDDVQIVEVLFGPFGFNPNDLNAT